MNSTLLSKIKKKNINLFLHDLSFYSFTDAITKFALEGQSGSSFLVSLVTKIPKEYTVNDFQEDIYYDDNRDAVVKDIHNLINKLTENLGLSLGKWPLLFPTRMFRPLDISIMCSSKKNEQTFIEYVNALRGTHITNTEINSDDSNVVPIKNKLLDQKNRNIGISSYQLYDAMWLKSVHGKPNRSITRYKQLQDIVEEALRKESIDYLVLPELAIPRDWAYMASKKLATKNISFITGVEYQHAHKKTVYNSVYIFLLADDIGFNYVTLIRQDKEKAAFDEGVELQNIAGLSLEADVSFEKKHIIDHAGFMFGVLICNELTDISLREYFRGKIDALFVVEWNKDLKSFNALVESAALDTHAYIIQANNRKYGDSRIRAPFKDDYRRDIVQIRGGIHDYLVVGTINIESLRNFQNHSISPKKDFKPVPTGFCMSDVRRSWGSENDRCERDDNMKDEE